MTPERFPKSARLRKRGEFLRVQEAGASSTPIAFSCSCCRRVSRVRPHRRHRITQARGRRSAQPRKTPGAGSLPAPQVVVPRRARPRLRRQEERRRDRVRTGGTGDREAVPKILSAFVAAVLLRRDRLVSVAVVADLRRARRALPLSSARVPRTPPSACVTTGRRAAVGARSSGSAAATRSTLAGTIRRFHRIPSMDKRVLLAVGDLDGRRARLDHLLRQATATIRSRSRRRRHRSRARRRRRTRRRPRPPTRRSSRAKPPTPRRPTPRRPTRPRVPPAPPAPKATPVETVVEAAEALQGDLHVRRRGAVELGAAQSAVQGRQPEAKQQEVRSDRSGAHARAEPAACTSPSRARRSSCRPTRSGRSSRAAATARSSTCGKTRRRASRSASSCSRTATRSASSSPSRTRATSRSAHFFQVQMHGWQDPTVKPGGFMSRPVSQTERRLLRQRQGPPQDVRRAHQGEGQQAGLIEEAATCAGSASASSTSSTRSAWRSRSRRAATCSRRRRQHQLDHHRRRSARCRRTARPRTRWSRFMGPKILSQLDDVKIGGQSARFGDVMEYRLWGLTEWLARPMLAILKAVHFVVPSWGFAIILLTILIKIATWYPTQKSMKSMKAMAKLKPEMDKLKERFGDDKNKLNMATMELYKKHGVNPLGGCLPMLIQMPVYFALYSMLGNSVELYRSPFLLGARSDGARSVLRAAGADRRAHVPAAEDAADAGGPAPEDDDVHDAGDVHRLQPGLAGGLDDLYSHEHGADLLAAVVDEPRRQEPTPPKAVDQAGEGMTMEEAANVLKTILEQDGRRARGRAVGDRRAHHARGQGAGDGPGHRQEGADARLAPVPRQQDRVEEAGRGRRQAHHRRRRGVSRAARRGARRAGAQAGGEGASAPGGRWRPIR